MNDFVIKFAAFVLIALLLLKTPVAGKYVSLVNTLIHEVGHALVTILTGGKVAKIELFANTEGTAWSRHRFFFGGVLTSAAGYPAASGTAFLFVCFAVNGDFQYILLGLLAVLVVSALFWIRNLYGILWVATFGSAFTYLLWLDNAVLSENVALFLTAILCVASVTTAFDILKISVKTPRDSGDASNLATQLWIPAQFWGVLFFAQALAFAFQGMLLILSVVVP